MDSVHRGVILTLAYPVNDGQEHHHEYHDEHQQNEGGSQVLHHFGDVASGGICGLGFGDVLNIHYGSSANSHRHDEGNCQVQAQNFLSEHGRSNLLGSYPLTILNT